MTATAACTVSVRMPTPAASIKVIVSDAPNGLGLVNGVHPSTRVPLVPLAPNGPSRREGRDGRDCIRVRKASVNVPAGARRQLPPPARPLPFPRLAQDHQRLQPIDGGSTVH